MKREMRMTAHVAVVLRAFLEDPDEPRYGMELMKLTGLPSGTLYPLLARLRRDHWLISDLEDIDPKVEKRPPRRYFRINPAVAERARYEVDSLAQKLVLPPMNGTARRPGLAGGMA
jgi:PadR family transcriptional regulator PadR